MHILQTDNPREKTHFWQVDGLEVLSASYITHRFARHIHNSYAIGVIERGAETFFYRGSTHTAHAGSVVVVQPGEIHDGTALTEHGWSYRMIYPEAWLVDQIAAEINLTDGITPFFPQPVIHDPPLATALRHLHLTLEHVTSKIERDTHMRAALGGLLLRHTREITLHVAAEPNAVKRAREYLEAHYDQNVSLDELAAAAVVSPFHLARLFRQQTGLPPHAYLTHLRITHAKQRLAQGQPIADVAAAVGFSDQSHLTRWFKRIVGVTPGQFTA
jgi:AraC-like DNA-binding protein